MAAAADATAQPDEPRTLTNFGGNQTWRARTLQPRTEQEVLDILTHHRAARIRPFGALHSWSDAAVSSDVSLDMSAFDQVESHAKDDTELVRVGAGCWLQDLLDRLHAAGERTLPTLGAIKRQTVSGAISTATHGSGNPSLSHFVAALRVAAYDPDGNAKIFDYESADALKAARCALGHMGVILSVDLQTVPKYLVEETVRQHGTLQDVLSRLDERPLTQFVLAPYGWAYVAWERSAVAMRPRTAAEWIKAWFFRLYNPVSVDVAFHLLVKAAVALGAGAVKALMRLMPRLLVKNVVRLDDAEHVLTLGHHYFRHEEMEMFLPQSRLEEAVQVLRAATDVFAGEATPVPEAVATKLNLHNLHGELIRHTGSYVHHYPFFFRRILPEDALISMTGGAEEPYFSVSVFTYLPPDRRRDYDAFCSWLARAMNRLFAAKLHWGKHFPLGVADIARLYPDLEKFRALCRTTDPSGVFRNDYSKRVLGL